MSKNRVFDKHKFMLDMNKIITYTNRFIEEEQEIKPEFTYLHYLDDIKEDDDSYMLLYTIINNITTFILLRDNITKRDLLKIQRPMQKIIIESKPKKLTSLLHVLTLIIEFAREDYWEYKEG